MNVLTIEEIKKLNYTDFLSLVDQWNVPPGSISTINEWTVFGHVNKESRVLEIACSTGFSGRELSKFTGCSVYGIDICESSIQKARAAAQHYAPECDLHYEQIDLYEFVTDRKFTHIIIGAAIQFFKDKERLVDILSTLLEDGGIILASPYYLKGKTLPNDLIQEAEKVIEITPTNFGYNVAMDYYKNFEIIYQSRKDIIIETKYQMEKYTYDTIRRSCELSNISYNQEIFSYLYQRLYEIKNVCNKIHSYHSYSVLVLRFTQQIYPNRFVEMF